MAQKILTSSNDNWGVPDFLREVGYQKMGRYLHGTVAKRLLNFVQRQTASSRHGHQRPSSSQEIDLRYCKRRHHCLQVALPKTSWFSCKWWKVYWLFHCNRRRPKGVDHVTVWWRIHWSLFLFEYGTLFRLHRSCWSLGPLAIGRQHSWFP